LIEIAPAQVSDIPSLLELYRHLHPLDPPVSFASAPQLLEQLSRYAGSSVLVGKVDNRGMVRLAWNSPKGRRAIDHKLFAFFKTKPNDVVGAIHEKAMPVILRTEEERDVGSAPHGTRRRHRSDPYRTAPYRLSRNFLSSTFPDWTKFRNLAILCGFRSVATRSKEPKRLSVQ
jgi:hypothetical protein